MPRGGSESWRDRFLRETKNNKKPGGGTNPFAKKAKAKPKRKPKKKTA